MFRDSCYRCIYKDIHRIGDISIGDVPGDFDALGENVVLVNTVFGEKAVECLKNNDSSGILTKADNDFQSMICTKYKIKEKIPKLRKKIIECNNTDIVMHKYLKYSYLRGKYNKIVTKIKSLMR